MTTVISMYYVKSYYIIRFLLPALLLVGCSESIDPTKDTIIVGDYVLLPGTYQVLVDEDHTVIVRHDGHNYNPWEYSRIREIH